MDVFAHRSPRERAEVFEETASRRGIGRAAIVEKDFWVCWVLRQLGPLFLEPALGPSPDAPHPPAGLLFKGGTSLSKVYGAIQRFSEDIDLTIDRDTLDLPEDLDPEQPNLSAKKRKQIIDRIIERGAQFVVEVVQPILIPAIADIDRSVDATSVHVSPSGDIALHLIFPRSLGANAYAEAAYVRPEVLLEFGIRGELWPAHRDVVEPFVAEEFPDLFRSPTAVVNVLDLARTLWEKATILHQVAHVGIPERRQRMSRHYYDLAQLIATPEGELAVMSTDLLRRVAEHKAKFFRQAGAHYDLARPGSLRIIPSDATVAMLRRDYAAMSEMFFSPPPLFDEVLDALHRFETAINRTAESAPG